MRKKHVNKCLNLFIYAYFGYLALYKNRYNKKKFLSRAKNSISSFPWERAFSPLLVSQQGWKQRAGRQSHTKGLQGQQAQILSSLTTKPSGLHPAARNKASHCWAVFSHPVLFPWEPVLINHSFSAIEIL